MQPDALVFIKINARLGQALPGLLLPAIHVVFGDVS